LLHAPGDRRHLTGSSQTAQRTGEQQGQNDVPSDLNPQVASRGLVLTDDAQLEAPACAVEDKPQQGCGNERKDKSQMRARIAQRGSQAETGNCADPGKPYPLGSRQGP
jgi:hypothetical protein